MYSEILGWEKWFISSKDRTCFNKIFAEKETSFLQYLHQSLLEKLVGNDPRLYGMQESQIQAVGLKKAQ